MHQYTDAFSGRVKATPISGHRSADGELIGLGEDVYFALQNRASVAGLTFTKGILRPSN